ncbi:CheR family methyltransferase [Chelativorans salis]|uniref:Protein-glutamate O-methyltransferase CheR n=1 Tax=Chelativorans salis TaxID=2978478 RepID=A0ABT2LK19_9HYPH|nr:protein-glutamate O-methyltransferase CheR [Chelativorans sp. EGI FJ00035]MCT7374369.1 protein-glutamate O-methyltransferase CheR [Chelativorans sp. EGI FJ00035]
MTAARYDLHSIYSLVPQFGRKVGLSVPASREKAVVSAIRCAMEKRGIEDGTRFMDQIGRDQDLTDEIVAEATVGETYFFRDPSQFEVIRNFVLPSLLCERPENAPIRVWSAGCSTGEEPYSLAILAEEEGLADRISIIATDVSRRALKKAREAEYGEWSLRNGGMPFLKRYFARRGDDFRLERRLARRVSFHRHSLGVDDVPSPKTGIAAFDLILCRNVLIYLETGAARRVARQLYDCLSEGGWLLFGPSDPPLWKYAPFETVITPAGVICQREARRDGQENALARAAGGGF